MILKFIISLLEHIFSCLCTVVYIKLSVCPDGHLLVPDYEAGAFPFKFALVLD